MEYGRYFNNVAFDFGGTRSIQSARFTGLNKSKISVEKKNAVKKIEESIRSMSFAHFRYFQIYTLWYP